MSEERALSIGSSTTGDLDKRAAAVDTDVERDAHFVRALTKHREQAAKEGKAFKVPSNILSVPRFFIQRGLDAELSWLHPSRQRRCSEDLEAKCSDAGITMEHLGITIGSVLHGLNLQNELPQNAINAIRQTLLERKVVFFRDQTLTREQHLAFGRRFGTLEVHPFVPSIDAQYPEILGINHGVKAPGTENNWHSDVTWRAEPSLGSILYCTQAPEFGGGDTLFSDSHAQFAGLPSELREHASGLNAKHDFLYFRRGLLRAGVPESFVKEMAEKYPMPSHPVIRTHPETGKQSVYINRAFTQYVEGLEKEKGDGLAQALYRMATIPEYQCRFTWGTGSIAFWDNRACQHYAAADYFPQKRTMERVTICGDRPYYDPEVAPVNFNHAAKGRL